MKGISVVVTYKCNIRCSCCRYDCGPHRKGIMGIGEFTYQIEKNYRDGFSNYIIIEGGEPLLESAIVFKYLKSIKMINADKYIVTNGYWGNIDMYLDILGDFKKVGLKGIIFEYDFFHSVFINMDILREAVLMCEKSGLERMFRADFLSGDIKNEIDFKTFEYIKDIKREFNNSKFIFNELNKNTKVFGRSYLKEERVIYYKG